MKICKPVFLLIFVSIIVACDDDDVSLDTKAPVVEILSPTENDTFLAIEMIESKTKVVDDREIKSYQVFLVYPDGTSKQLVMKDELYRNMALREYAMPIMLPKDVDTGVYKLVTEVKDWAQNVGKNSVEINIQASEIGKEQFAQAFTNTSNLTVFDKIDWSWVGYDIRNEMDFDSTMVSFVFFKMVDIDNNENVSETEWGDFTEDFKIKNQKWSAWDVNSDGVLNSSEFYYGLRHLNFFSEWDLDHNDHLKKDEFVNMIFDNWDDNKDGLLAREEYLERFHTYFRR